LIFVTVGTHDQGFERLVRKIDDLVEEKKIRDNVIIQTGYTEYKPKACKWFKFVSPQEFEKICKKSSLIITHAGVGSIMTCLKFSKSIIVVPRLKKFNEHRDDHQLQITKELENQGKILAVYDVDKLENMISRAKIWRPKKSSKENKILSLVDNYLKSLI
jgi:UDP-N-acetylglucosamine transferase subunit ALG13